MSTPRNLQPWIPKAITMAQPILPEEIEAGIKHLQQEKNPVLVLTTLRDIANLVDEIRKKIGATTELPETESQDPITAILNSALSSLSPGKLTEAVESTAPHERLGIIAAFAEITANIRKRLMLVTPQSSTTEENKRMTEETFKAGFLALHIIMNESQNSLALKIGITQSTISQLKDGRTRLSPTSGRKIIKWITENLAEIEEKFSQDQNLTTTEKKQLRAFLDRIKKDEMEVMWTSETRNRATPKPITIDQPYKDGRKLRKYFAYAATLLKKSSKDIETEAQLTRMTVASIIATAGKTNGQDGVNIKLANWLKTNSAAILAALETDSQLSEVEKAELESLLSEL